MLTSLMFDMLL